MNSTNRRIVNDAKTAIKAKDSAAIRKAVDEMNKAADAKRAQRKSGKLGLGR